jgi:hypothetical protein
VLIKAYDKKTYLSLILLRTVRPSHSNYYFFIIIYSCLSLLNLASLFPSLSAFETRSYGYGRAAYNFDFVHDLVDLLDNCVNGESVHRQRNSFLLNTMFANENNGCRMRYLRNLRCIYIYANVHDDVSIARFGSVGAAAAADPGMIELNGPNAASYDTEIATKT